MHSLLGLVSEACWLRFAHNHLAAEFPHLPEEPSRPPHQQRLVRLVLVWRVAGLANDSGEAQTGAIPLMGRLIRCGAHNTWRPRRGAAVVPTLPGAAAF